MSLRGHFTISCSAEEHMNVMDAAKEQGITPSAFVKAAAMAEAKRVLCEAGEDDAQRALGEGHGYGAGD